MPKAIVRSNKVLRPGSRRPSRNQKSGWLGRGAASRSELGVNRVVPSSCKESCEYVGLYVYIHYVESMPCLALLQLKTGR